MNWASNVNEWCTCPHQPLTFSLALLTSPLHYSHPYVQSFNTHSHAIWPNVRQPQDLLGWQKWRVLQKEVEAHNSMPPPWPIPPPTQPCMGVRGCNLSVCWADLLFCTCVTQPRDRYWAVSSKPDKSSVCLFMAMLIPPQRSFNELAMFTAQIDAKKKALQVY